MKQYQKRAALLLAASVTAGALSGCAPQKITRTGFYLDTVVSVTLYDGGEAAADGAMELIARCDQLFSPTREDSDVVKINRAEGRPVTVDPDTAELIRHARRYAEMTQGAFDPTVAPETALWDFHAAQPSVPDEQALRQAARLVDWRAVRVDGDTVTLDGERRALDLGGVAKGYIADRLRDYLTDQGVKRALIDLGGNIYALGDKNGGSWTIGVKDPARALAGEDGLAVTIQVRDQAVVTSGVYERGFEQEGVRYHHLLDPATGMPVRNGLASVTIVSADSTLADALSTACFVMGLEKGLALTESLEGVEALFIEDSGAVMATSGLSYTKSGGS